MDVDERLTTNERTNVVRVRECVTRRDRTERTGATERGVDDACGVDDAHRSGSGRELDIGSSTGST